MESNFPDFTKAFWIFFFSYLVTGMAGVQREACQGRCSNCRALGPERLSKSFCSRNLMAKLSMRPSGDLICLGDGRLVGPPQLQPGGTGGRCIC